MAVVDALGYLVRFVIRRSQAHDLMGVPDLLEGLPFGALVGDKAFEAEWLLGAEAVIPSKWNRKVPRDNDREMYKWRQQIKNFFAKTNEFRAVTTGYDKTDESFPTATHLIAGVVTAT